MNVAGVIVAYNPDIDTVKNVIRNCAIIGRVVIVDNSIHKNILFEYLDGVDYIHLGKNMGIGFALNHGIKFLEKEGFDWYLTLDQDSSLPEEYLLTAHNISINLIEKRLGIISPVHLQNGKIIENDIKFNTIRKVDSVMMSGNLLSARAYRSCGPFNEEMFIDYVDIEYCLRLNTLRFEVILTDNLRINHSLGRSEWIEFFNLKFKPTNHNYLRRYYITRNRIIVWRKFCFLFPKFVIIDILRFFKEAIYISLFEKDKFRKFSYLLLGVNDALRNKMGKIAC